MLNNAYNSVEGYLYSFGDGLIARGVFNFLGANAVQVQVQNANNHQITYGVLASALEALERWTAQNGCVLGAFVIRDGPNVVGTGSITG